MRRFAARIHRKLLATTTTTTTIISAAAATATIPVVLPLPPLLWTKARTGQTSTFHYHHHHHSIITTTLSKMSNLTPPSPPLCSSSLTVTMRNASTSPPPPPPPPPSSVSVTSTLGKETNGGTRSAHVLPPCRSPSPLLNQKRSRSSSSRKNSPPPSSSSFEKDGAAPPPPPRSSSSSSSSSSSTKPSPKKRAKKSTTTSPEPATTTPPLPTLPLLPPVKTFKEFIRSPPVMESLNEKKAEKNVWNDVIPFHRRSKPSDFDPSQMLKFITWNVAGLRGVLRKDPDSLKKFLAKEKPDILCLQETKLNPAEEKENRHVGEVPGYTFVDHISHTKKGYSGTRVYLHLSRVAHTMNPVVTCGFSFPEEAASQQPPSAPQQPEGGVGSNNNNNEEEEEEASGEKGKKKPPPQKNKKKRSASQADKGEGVMGVGAGGGVTLRPGNSIKTGSDHVCWAPDAEGRVQTVWLHTAPPPPPPPTSAMMNHVSKGGEGVCNNNSNDSGSSAQRRSRSPSTEVSTNTTTHLLPTLALVNTYIPNSGMTLDRLPYRIEHFDAAMRSYLFDIQQRCRENAEAWSSTHLGKGNHFLSSSSSSCEKGKEKKKSPPRDAETTTSTTKDNNNNNNNDHEDFKKNSSCGGALTPYPSGIIWAGDLNVAERDFDRYYAGTWEKMQECSGFTPEERFSFRETLERLGGARDTFREIYPQAGPTYTFWSNRINGRAKGLGWRLDYFVVSKELMPFVVDVFPMPEIYGSDHCPVQMWLKKEITHGRR